MAHLFRDLVLPTSSFCSHIPREVAPPWHCFLNFTSLFSCCLSNFLIPFQLILYLEFGLCFLNWTLIDIFSHALMVSLGLQTKYEWCWFFKPLWKPDVLESERIRELSLGVWCSWLYCRRKLFWAYYKHWLWQSFLVCCQFSLYTV